MAYVPVCGKYLEPGSPAYEAAIEKLVQLAAQTLEKSA